MEKIVKLQKSIHRKVWRKPLVVPIELSLKFSVDIKQTRWLTKGKNILLTSGYKTQTNVHCNQKMYNEINGKHRLKKESMFLTEEINRIQ